MDRFKTFEGRQPVWLDDFTYIQNATLSEIKKLVLELSGLSDTTPVIILSGCVKISGQNNSYTEGVIYYNGEILSVPAAKLQANMIPCFDIVTAYDPAGDRLMAETGEERSCYELRSAKIVGQSATSSLPEVDKQRRLHDILIGKFGARERVLYEGDSLAIDGITKGHFRLSLHDGTFILNGSFDGLKPSFELEVDDEYAAAKLGDAHVTKNLFWKKGTTYGTAAVKIQNDANKVIYATAPVAVYAQPDERLESTILSVEVLNESGYADWTNGNIACQGGFTIVLNTI